MFIYLLFVTDQGEFELVSSDSECTTIMINDNCMPGGDELINVTFSSNGTTVTLNVTITDNDTGMQCIIQSCVHVCILIICMLYKILMGNFKNNTLCTYSVVF